MCDDRMLEIIEEQERVLRFGSVSVEKLSAIGEAIVSAIKAKGAFAYVMIRVNGLEVFSQAIAGA